MFKHLLVPTDGSELSIRTIQRAVGFAGEIGARITFFAAKRDYPVSFFGPTGLTDPETRQKFIDAADREAADNLAAALAEARAVGVDAAAVSEVCETPHDGIIAAALGRDCDLIFMASHGRRGLKGLLLGSETHKVLTYSTIPVLVYR